MVEEVEVPREDPDSLSKIKIGIDRTCHVPDLTPKLILECTHVNSNIFIKLFCIL